MTRSRKILLWLGAILLILAALVFWLARGDRAGLPLDKVAGTDPVLVDPEAQTVPTIAIAEPVGWAKGEAPAAAKGLVVSRFAEGLEHPRTMHTLPNGDVLVALTREPKSEGGGFTSWVANLLMTRAGATGPSPNEIVLLRDSNGDGVADVRKVLTDKLESPSGIAWGDDTLYIANHNALLAFPYKLGEEAITGAPRKLMDLPGGGNHWMRNLELSPDGKKLYIAVGSSSNIGENGMKAEEGRAVIWEYNLASGRARIFGSGLRNPNGLDWNPWSGELWTTVNERDMLGSDLVPDYLTNVPIGVQYGWPWIYYRDKFDDRVKEPMPAYLQEYARRPEFALGPHVAALGLAFTKGGHRMGPAFAQGAFIAEHGSWNRKPPSGYDVVFVRFDDRGSPVGKPVPVLTGFLTGKGTTHGRPTWVAWANDGALLVSDDTAGIIWRVIDPKAAPAPEIARLKGASLRPQRELHGDPSAAFTDEFARKIPMPMPLN